MNEWGVFNDEGCIEDGFWSPYEATIAAEQYRQRYANDEDNGDPFAYAGEICPDHPDQVRWSCDECD